MRSLLSSDPNERLKHGGGGEDVDDDEGCVNHQEQSHPVRGYAWFAGIDWDALVNKEEDTGASPDNP